MASVGPNRRRRDAEWPSHACAVFTSTPAATSSVAFARLRSWNVRLFGDDLDTVAEEARRARRLRRRWPGL